MAELVTVTESTIRKNTFLTLARLLENNLDEDWLITSDFPDEDPKFPCIVINPTNISLNKLGMRIDAREFEISVLVEFFSPNNEGMKGLDSMRQFLQDTIIANDATLATNGLLIAADQPFLDSDATTIEVNTHKLKTASTTLAFTLR